MTERHSLGDAPFAGYTGKGVTVAVLDSGIHADHPHVGGVLSGASFINDPERMDFVDRIGHGTAVAAAIREKSPGVALLAVKVFHRQLSTSVDVLAGAIVWAADEGAHLINLSLGTANAAHAAVLAEAIVYARARESVVVSASMSGDTVWFPGSLAGVIGVRADPGMGRDQLDVADGGWSSCVASPYPRPIPGVPVERNLSGVSFAVANTTGFLARLIERAGGNPKRAGLLDIVD